MKNEYAELYWQKALAKVRKVLGNEKIEEMNKAFGKDQLEKVLLNSLYGRMMVNEDTQRNGKCNIQ